MRQKAYLGAAVLSAVAFIGSGCSDDENDKTAGTGGANAAEGGNSSAAGSSPTGGAVSNGGTSSTAGGAPGAAGNTGTVDPNVPMTAGQNIINAACEVGGGAEVMGVIGGFYLFADQDAEHPNGQSCTIPPSGTKACESVDANTTGICLSGTTIKDATYAAWGCGMGLSLNTMTTTTTGTDGAAGAPGVAGAPGAAGAPGVAGAAGAAGAAAVEEERKLPYSGPATCFELTFTGTTGGLTLRVGFTQYADPTVKTQSVAPFKTLRAFTNGWTGKVCFADVTCPNWSSAPGQGCPANMVATPSSSYDLQVQVPGGDGANTYDFCLTKVVPLKPAVL